MIRYILATTLLCSIGIAEPKPILVLLESNPWLMVAGSDSPTFALYDDGTEIYISNKSTAEEPFRTRKVPDPKKILKELLSFGTDKTKDYYDLTDASDQPTTMIWTPSSRIEIYGQWRKSHYRHQDPSKALPSEIRRALFCIDDHCKNRGKAWLPAQVEVLFWPYEYAPDESVVWPSDWPDLASKDTRKRGSDLFSVYLPVVHFAEFRRLIATQREKGAILVNGKKMAVSYRLPFPGETEWRKRAGPNKAAEPSRTAVTAPAAAGARASGAPGSP
jgi:hypothetical protein